MYFVRSFIFLPSQQKIYIGFKKNQKKISAYFPISKHALTEYRIDYRRLSSPYICFKDLPP